jgi:hypothetical protein
VQPFERSEGGTWRNLERASTWCGLKLDTEEVDGLEH